MTKLQKTHDYDDRDVECQSPNPECWGGPAFDWEGDDYYECRDCMVARISSEQRCPYRLGPLPKIPPLPHPNCDGECSPRTMFKIVPRKEEVTA